MSTSADKPVLRVECYNTSPAIYVALQDSNGDLLDLSDYTFKPRDRFLQSTSPASQRTLYRPGVGADYWPTGDNQLIQERLFLACFQSNRGLIPCWWVNYDTSKNLASFPDGNYEAFFATWALESVEGVQCGVYTIIGSQTLDILAGVNVIYGLPQRLWIEFTVQGV